MSRSAHDDAHRREIARLLELLGERAERRQLVARDRRRQPGEDLIVIADGQADALRPACRAGDIMCPVDTCPTPALTTRGGSRRDHFVHLRGRRDSHGPERLAHQHGKAVIADWVRRRYRSLDVRTEAAVETGQRADVLVTSPSGKRLAIEMQCASLTADEWRARHQCYSDADIRAQWLWWNQPPHLRPPRGDESGEPGLARRPALLNEIRGADLPWLWFDPFNAIVALAVADERIARPLGCVATSWHGQHVGIVPFALQACTLGEAGLVHSSIAQLAAEEERVAEEDRRVAERIARAREERERDRQAREAAARERFDELLAGAPEPRHPALRRLVADMPDGGPMLTEDLCEGTLRLVAIADAAIVGRQASVWAVEAQIERRLEVPAEHWDAIQRAYAALLEARFVSGGRFVGSLHKLPSSAEAERSLAAATRARTQPVVSSRVVTPTTPAAPGREPAPDLEPRPDAQPATSSDAAPRRPVHRRSPEHRLAQARGPRLAIIEAREQRGEAAALDVVAHVATCHECARHRFAGGLTLGHALVWARGPREGEQAHGDVRLSALAGSELDAVLVLIAAERTAVATTASAQRDRGPDGL